MNQEPMSPLLIEDIFVLICENINSLEDLLNFGSVSTFHRKNIHKYPWRHIPIFSSNIQNIISTFNFKYFYLSHTNITDESVKLLTNCHTLDLYRTKVTDDCIKFLRSFGCKVNKFY